MVGLPRLRLLLGTRASSAPETLRLHCGSSLYILLIDTASSSNLGCLADRLLQRVPGARILTESSPCSMHPPATQIHTFVLFGVSFWCPSFGEPASFVFMPAQPYFDPIIVRYIRERLASECKQRGLAAELSRITGFSRNHLSNVIDGTRAVGDAFADAMCSYWGIHQSDLASLAHKAYESDALADLRKTHPELDITLEFFHHIYPLPFLREFEPAARQRPDQPRLQWFIELNAQFRRWVGGLAPCNRRKYERLLELPLTSLEIFERNPPGRPRKSASK